MKKIMLILLMSTVVLIQLFPVSPTIILGLGINTMVMSDEAGNPLFDLLGDAHGLFSYRNTLGENGYYAVLASIECNGVEKEPYLYSDEEIISLETGYRFTNSTLIGKGIFQSSVTGTEVDIPYFSPEWEILYYFITERKKIQPFLSYQGYYFNEPDSDEDVFYEGVEFGIKQRPELTRGYNVRIGFGWEYWPEYPVYSFPDITADKSRNDFLCMITGTMDGIFKYFLDWEVILSVLYRFSNAAMYAEEYNYFAGNSEERLVINSEIICKWSPSRYFHISFHPLCSPEFYTHRKALISPNTISGDNLWSLTAGGDFRIDWTPDNTFYAYAAADGYAFFSNEMADMAWTMTCHLGLEYSMRL